MQFGRFGVSLAQLDLNLAATRSKPTDDIAFGIDLFSAFHREQPLNFVEIDVDVSGVDIVDSGSRVVDVSKCRPGRHIGCDLALSRHRHARLNGTTSPLRCGEAQ